VQDLQDGTWALAAAPLPGSSAAASAGLRFACLGSGAGAVLAATEAGAGSAACTRFWLYGTPSGSYALLSAGAGSFLVSSGAGELAPITGGSMDPRTTPMDGSRFELQLL